MYVFIYSKIGLGPLKFEKDPLKFNRGSQGPFQLILMGNTEKLLALILRDGYRTAQQ